MTSTRYYLERLAILLGYQRKTQRMSEASSEAQLLHEAEMYLGAQIWPRTEEIDDLSNEYWGLRKLAREKEELQKRIDERQKELDQANQERAALIKERASREDPKLSKQRGELTARLEKLGDQREEVTREGKSVQRRYNGLKTKLEVLTTEGGDHAAEIAGINDELAELRNRFAELKKQRADLTEQLTAGDAELDALNEEIEAHGESSRKEAVASFSAINELTKNLWQLRSDNNLLEARIARFHTAIGRHISVQASSDGACAKVASGHKGLVDVMHALRRSIALNHKLADNR